MNRSLSLALCLAILFGGVPAHCEVEGLIEAGIGPRPWPDDRSTSPTRSLVPEGLFVAQTMEDDATAPADVDARIAELEMRQSQIDTRGPLIATVVGSVLTGVGLIIGTTVGLGCGASSEAGAACSPEHAIGFGVGAALRNRREPRVDFPFDVRLDLLRTRRDTPGRDIEDRLFPEISPLCARSRQLKGDVRVRHAPDSFASSTNVV